MSFRDTLREVRDLGVRRTLFRAWWEARLASGAMRVTAPRPPRFDPAWLDPRYRTLPFAAPEEVRGVLPAAEVQALLAEAENAAHGRLRCFGRWSADFGDPIDWYREERATWPSSQHWSSISLDAPGRDVKLIWEAARFSHAYTLARAAAHCPERADEFGAALRAQIDAFVAASPFGRGVHWASGYEIALRSLAWIFALHVFAWDDRARQRVLGALYANAVHVEAFFDFARLSCDNDHLVGEALLLYIASLLFGRAPRARAWRAQALRSLDEQASVQIHPDGAYFMASHNYHRAVLQMLALAVVFRRSEGEAVPESWLSALRRSRDFLAAQQNPTDGRLPNFGSNDGGVPLILGSSDYSDFRPVLQSISAIACGERLYPEGVWDEEMLWMTAPHPAFGHPLPASRGEGQLAPSPRLRGEGPRSGGEGPSLLSRSFPSGYHVLRGTDPSNFAVLRCGTIRSRFPQIDMLHLDVWWRGRNVLADGGTYVYNGAPEWQAHFVRTASHNTVSIDGQDQMLHYRQFKVLYWTEARLLRFEPPVAAGEHYGYARLGCVHRRTVLLLDDDLWIVVDRIEGEGSHDLRLQWLGGESAFTHDAPHRLTMQTPDGPFSVAAYGEDGTPLDATVVAGAEAPPRGWLSRYYGEKVAVPSFAVERRAALPFVFVSVLGAGAPAVNVDGDEWEVRGQRFALP